MDTKSGSLIVDRENARFKIINGLNHQVFEETSSILWRLFEGFVKEAV